jgi:hypothetical protein
MQGCFGIYQSCGKTKAYHELATTYLPSFILEMNLPIVPFVVVYVK